MRRQAAALFVGTAVAACLLVAVSPSVTTTTTLGEPFLSADAVPGARTYSACASVRTGRLWGTLPSPFSSRRCNVSVHWPVDRDAGSIPVGTAEAVRAASDALAWDHLLVTNHTGRRDVDRAQSAQETVDFHR